MSTVADVFNHFFSSLIGTEQKRAVERIRDNWCKDEENAAMFNKMLDEIERRAKEGK